MIVIYAILLSLIQLQKTLSLELSTRIIGGNAINIKDLPYQVSVQFLETHICGGAIISSTFVLTAAHCIVKNSPPFISVRAGTSYVNDEGVVLSVKNIYLHPKYDRTSNELDYDIAVLELKNILRFGPTINTVKLPKLNENFPAGTSAVVSGWGKIMDGVPLSVQLQSVTVQISDFDLCQDTYYKTKNLIVTNRMICAGVYQGGKDACDADSGSPLVSSATNTLIGIVSWGEECGSKIYPGVYANVAQYRKFINEITGF